MAVRPDAPRRSSNAVAAIALILCLGSMCRNSRRDRVAESHGRSGGRWMPPDVRKRGRKRPLRDQSAERVSKPNAELMQQAAVEVAFERDDEVGKLGGDDPFPVV